MNSVELVKLLIEFGAKLYSVNIQQANAAHLATREGTDVLNFLLEKGISPLVRDKNKHTLLHYAARYNNTKAILFLLEIEIIKNNMDLKDRWQRTPLHWAILNGNYEVSIEVVFCCCKTFSEEFILPQAVDILLKANAELEIVTSKKTTKRLIKSTHLEVHLFILLLFLQSNIKYE